MKTNSNMLKASALALCVLGLGLAGAVADNAAKLQYERGTIKSVDPAHHSLIVTDSKGKAERTFQWNDQTKFTVSGKAATATTLKAGEHVLVGYEPGKGTLTMKTVELTPAKAAKQHSSLPQHTSRP